MIIDQHDNGTLTVAGTCQVTGHRYSVTVPQLGYDSWIAGALIQEVLPDVAPEDREWLISGISPEGWEPAFGEDADPVNPPDGPKLPSGPALLADLLFGPPATVRLESQQDKNRALIVEIRASRLDGVHEMISLGADVNARGGPQHLSVLEWAVMSGRPDLVKRIIDAGADVNDADDAGGTALHLAICDSTPECLEILIDAGADVEAVHEQLGTPLRYASLSGKAEFVERLIQEGADMAFADSQSGETPLLSAAINQHFDVATVLLSAAADPYAQGPLGWTALHWAVCGVHHALVSLLFSTTPELLPPIIAELVEIGKVEKALQVLEALPESNLSLLTREHLEPLLRFGDPTVRARAECLSAKLDPLATLVNDHKDQDDHKGQEGRLS